MIFGPTRQMPPMQQNPFPFGGQSFLQQPNMFTANPMMRNPSSFMGAGRGMNMGGTNGGGGLLAKLFGRSGARSIGNMGGLGQLANSGGGLGQLANTGALQQLANPGNLTGMLTNVQKALKMAESVMPMVQQYGPLVRNVPAMIKLYSELKNVDDSDDEEEQSTNTSSESEKEKTEGTKTKKGKQASSPKKKKEKLKPTNPPQVKGTSSPKLYV